MCRSTLAMAVVVDQRSLRDAALEAVAHLDRFRLRRQLLDESVVDAFLDVDAVGADAGLSGIAVLAGNGAFDGARDVGVIEDDERRVATQLERELLDRRRALLHQDAPDFGRSRERQVTHDIARAQHVADLDRTLRVGGEDVQHPRRHAGALGELGNGQRRERRLLGGFDDHGAACCQRRRHLAGDHGDREVPRRDRCADADRLLDDEVALVGVGGRNRLAIDAPAFLGEPFDEARTVGDFAPGFRERLALLGRHDPRQIVGVLHQQLVPGMQDRGALLGRALAPFGPGRVGRCNRRVGVCSAEIGHIDELLSGCRVVDVEARIARQPLATDKRMGLQQRRVGQGRKR